MKNVENIYPLSPMQQGMLFHALYAPESDFYLVQLVRRLHGELSVSAFKSAWQLVADRHAVLRTSFLWENLDEPLQVVRKQVSLPWEELDLRRCSPSHHEEQIEQYLRADRDRGFVLSEVPMMRLSLIQLADDTYEFICTYHHILLDGWSISQVFDEVFTAYQALNHGQQPSFEAVYPFSDYIGWFQKRDMAVAEKFWRRTLRGFTAPTPPFGALPGGGTAGPRDSYHEQQLRLSSGVTTALQALARQHKLTMNTLMQGAWAILLSRYSGEEDIVFGAIVAGRPAELAGAVSMVGLFINTLPLRVRIATEESVLCWLEKLQEQQVDQRQYEYSPLVAVQEWSDIPRGLPLFESLLVFENYPADNSFESQITGLKIAPLRVIERTHYPITLIAEPGKELLLKISYSRPRLDDSMITRMLGHLETLLQGITEKPGARVTELPWLTQPEREQLLVEWNQTDTEYPKNRRIHELFEEQVKQTPERVAIVYGDEQLTYDELNRRSNQLARYLRKFGVGSEVLVGIFMERSVEMIVGLLGILKAGGAYVPLDPAFPNQRLSLMIEDARIGVLLTQQRFVVEPPLHAAKTVKLDADWHIIASESADNPMYSGSTEDLAYVIYTSGSTGKPKGVVGLHRASINRFEWMWRAYPFAPEEVYCQKTSLSFVDSIWEIFGPLLQGVPIVILPDEVVKDPRGFIESLRVNKVTRIVLVPSLLRVMLEDGSELFERLSRLKYWVCSGETLPVDLAEAFRGKLPGSLLINLYGSSEVAADVTCFEVRSTEWLASIPIGRPIANTQIYILDSNLQPLPVGIPGEIHVGGEGLARGYLNRPELTAEKFISNPFSDDPEARLYKTGDLARYLPDGNIECLGRIDNQVKIRGFRIEPGEIESVLRQHANVRESVVIAREDVPGDRRLVAYIVPSEDAEVDQHELRTFLSENLPEYMIPSAVVELAELPLTLNGKVNRRALPAPNYDAQMKGTYIAPRTPVEELLSGIWVEVLKVSRVGVNDNFFELGGHSLLATQVVSRALQTFHVQLPLRALFEAPTVARLAERIETARRASQEIKTAPISPVSRETQLPLSFAQQRLWFLDQLEPGSPLYSIPIALRLKGLLKHESLRRAINAIVDRHEGLRTTFATEQGKLVQVIAPERELPVPLVDLSHVPESDRQSVAQRLVMEEAEQPFNLASGPLFRAMLLRLGDEEHLLLLTMHHIVSDAWSMVVFREDLTTLYEAFSAGRPSPLPALPIQYADFAQWQLEVLEGELLREQIAYWRKQLAGVPAVLELPTDRPRPAVQTFRGAAKTVELPNELARQLRELSSREGVTLFMTLLAAFQTLLHRYSGQDDIVLGSPVVNRNRSELERLIGFFLNILVLRTNFSDNPTFRELLRRVREVALEAYAHQELPFEKLVEELQPQRSLSHNPLFQVMFVLKPPAQGELKLNDVSVEGITVDTRTSKLDLTLFVTEEPESLTCALEYNTDLFDGTTIDQMLRHYEQILKRVVANPEERIGQLSILSEAETSQLLIEWNAAATGYPSDKCFDQLFEEQVRRAPNALAVGFGDQELTYSELNRRANQLAHFLKKRGVGPDKLVGICVERSFDMIVGLLGILKAGGAYLPLDPTYPRERLSYMLEEGDVSVLLTQESLRRSLPYEEAICLDVDWSAINEESEKTPKKTTTSDNLVYVIYTSGSTGKPKGVMITHRGLLNYLHYASRAYAIDRGGGALVHSPIGFDLTVTSVFAPLISGSHVSLLPEERGIEALAATLKNGPGYSVLKVTPSHLEGLSYLLVPEDAAQSTRVLIVGGEALYAESLHFWRGAAPAMRIINEYGPTETVVGCCVYEIKQNDSITGPVPIGRPIANTELYILDRYLHPVPIGVVGELHIGGAGVARGYLNRPELTAERFWPNPFSKGPGARFYKTGDRARYLRDGNIEFLGRADDQVKIKGYRVELGEIESALAEHPWLVDSVVVAREDTPGNRLLVGYVVPAAGAEVERREIVNFLSDKLPEYMVPAVFVVLEALPLTPNGKVDHRALPPPDRSHRETGYVAARTLVEATLTDIWARVLGLDRVGIHDNFFELGGDSILSIQIIASANKVGLRLTTKHIFQYQTIAELAQVAGTAEFIRAEQGLVTGPVPLTPVQRWFFEQDLPELHHFNQAMLLEVRRSLDARLLREAAGHLLRHHDALRLRFVHEQVGWRQLNAEEDVGESFKYLDLSAITDRSSQDAALTTAAGELQASLNISVGPLFRLAFFDMGPKGSRLMLVIHHLAVDGVSWRILLEDLQTAYEQLERGEVVKLSLKTTSFKQWAERLKEHAHSGVLAPEIDFWLEEVRREVIRLPLDYAGGENIEGSADTVSMSLDAAETRALLQEVPAAYRTQINDGLLSALVESFAKWTGEPRLLVDLEGHGREEMIEGVDLSRTVGWFTSIFPVLLVGANGSRVEHLRSIKEQLRRVPNRGIGYGVLRYLSEDQQLGEQFFSYPQPELSFNYLGQFGQDHSEATMFVEAAENRGAPRSARQCRRYLLEVICFVKAGRLNVDWTYSRNIHRRATIEGLAQGFLLALRELVAGCQFVEDQVYSPSDFPDVQLSHRDLENILAEIGVADSKADSKDA